MEILVRENNALISARNLRFYRALRNNGYNITCGEIGFVGLGSAPLKDGGDRAYEELYVVYTIGDPMDSRNRSGAEAYPGRSYGCHFTNPAKFEPFVPTEAELMDYIKYCLKWVACMPDMIGGGVTELAYNMIALVLAYKKHVLRLDFSNFDNDLLLVLKGTNTDEVFINTFSSFYGQESIDKEVKSRPEMSVSALTKNLSAEQKEELCNEMISKVDRKRLRVLMSLAVSGRGRPMFLKNVEPVNAYLKRWAESKLPLYLLLGRRLSVSKHIEIEITDNEFNELLNELCEKDPRAALFFGYLRRMVPLDMIRMNKMSDAWNYDSVFTGVNGEIASSIAAQKKVTQAISRIFNDAGLDTAVSDIYAEKTIKTIIELSIDPYDFLTMSVNRHNWRSCHRIDGGEYSAGAFTYMTDSETLCAFAHNGRPYSFDSNKFKWSGNSKRWRQLVHVHMPTGSAIFSREYPMDSDPLSFATRELYEEVVSRFFNVENRWMLYNRPTRKVGYEPRFRYAYDDINNSDRRKRLVVQADNKLLETDIFMATGPVKCPMCGERDAVTGHTAVICSRCHDEHQAYFERTDDMDFDDSDPTDGEDFNPDEPFQIEAPIARAVRMFHDLTPRQEVPTQVSAPTAPV